MQKFSRKIFTESGSLEKKKEEEEEEEEEVRIIDYE